MSIKRSVQQGFTLIELMIVVAIIGILAAVAIPQYKDYTAKSKAASAITSIDAVKKAVAICAQEKGVLTGCTTGSAGAGIPAWTATPLVSAVTVTDGVVTATVPINAMGNTAAGSIVLTPSDPSAAGSEARIKWTAAVTNLPQAVIDSLQKNN